MKREIAMVVVALVALVGISCAANYMYEKADVRGIGYKNIEKIIQTQTGLAGNKLVENEYGSGNVLTDRTELEVQRDPFGELITQRNCSDYILFSKEAEFEYMPVSYQTGTYDAKWVDKLCVQNYYIGAVVTEMYSQAEHLQKNTEVNTRRDNGQFNDTGAEVVPECGACTGALEANFNSNVIGVAHIGWISKDVIANSKGRHPEYGRSVEDLTGVFSIEKFIQLWGNDTCGEVSVDWLPCI